MKELFILALSCIAVLVKLYVLLLLCSYIHDEVYLGKKYSGWQTVDIPISCTIKVPPEWEHYEENGIVYFVDKDQNPIMIQKDEEESSNKFFNTIEYVKTLNSVGLSIGIAYGKARISINDQECERYFLKTYSLHGYILLIVYDETIDIMYKDPLLKDWDELIQFLFNNEII